jgi:hypothetical protein
MDENSHKSSSENEDDLSSSGKSSSENEDDLSSSGVSKDQSEVEDEKGFKWYFIHIVYHYVLFYFTQLNQKREKGK